MAQPLPTRKAAVATFNGDFYEFITLSGYGRMTADPQGLRLILAPDRANEQLGMAARACLAKSRWLDTPEKRGDLFHPERIAQGAKVWQQSILARYSYKSKAAIFRQMRWVDIDEKLRCLELTPSCNDRGKNFTTDGITPDLVIHLPLEVNVFSLGAALREAFRRCRGAGAAVPPDEAS